MAVVASQYEFWLLKKIDIRNKLTCKKSQMILEPLK